MHLVRNFFVSITKTVVKMQDTGHFTGESDRPDRKSSDYFGVKKCFHSDFGINFHENRGILCAFNGMGENLCVDRLIT